MKNHRMRRACAACMTAVLLLTLCAGCGAQSVQPKQEQTKTLGLLLSQEDTFLSGLKAEIESQAAAQGYTVQYYNAQGDTDTQLRQVHEALASGLDTLIVNLTDSQAASALAGIVGDANVVLVSQAPEAAVLSETLVYVGSDEVQSGQLQGQALAEYFWQSQQGTDFRYLLFQGTPGQANTDARTSGAIQTLLDDSFYPIAAAEYQVCAFSRDQARSAMASLLARGVEFDCVICGNDEMALGVIEAMEAAGLDPAQVPIVGVDCTADGAAALADGKLYMTVDQNIRDQAAAAVAAAVNLNQGLAFDNGMDALLGSGYVPSEQPYSIRVPVQAVTSL